MRIAIVSTPRSGNTLVRRVLADVLELHQIAVHIPADIPSPLPERVILQIHWFKEPDFLRWLEENDFRVIVIARHPLDVLISILHFCRKEPQVARWLDGQARIPQNFNETNPTSRIFRDYALSDECGVLLSLSSDWWSFPRAIRTRFEDIVQSPNREFTRIISQIADHNRSISNAIYESRLEVFQSTPNHHGWQGRPGIWRELIPTSLVIRLLWRWRKIFLVLEYEFYPNCLLSKNSLINWWKLIRSN